MKTRCIVIGICMLVGAGKAAASNELNGLFDARSTGMGGTGVAFLDSAGAIPTNPALLEQIDTFTLTANAFLISSQPERPYPIYHLDASGRRYRTYETIRSDVEAPAVLPFLGGAFRILDRVVVGAALYPVIGQGTHATYRPAPDEFPDLEITNDAGLGFFEGSVPVSVRILDNLSLGLSWRVTYMTQFVETVQPGGPPAGVLLDVNNQPLAPEIKVTGWNFSGLQAGVLYAPIPDLRLGLSYRSKVTVDGEGTTTVADLNTGLPMELPTRQSFTNPHAFRIGLAASLLEGKLLLTQDFKYLMYAESWETLETTTVRNGVESVNVRELNWTDAFNIHLGVEYNVSDVVSLRGGYILATTATPEAFAQAFMAPPGLSHLGSVGLGIHAMETLSLDAAFAYVAVSSRVYEATPENAGAGYYASYAAQLALSATYHN
ncbi:MAG: outer membrane protein transport protein [Myxococcales bacterium]|nr:outer membrane protein transport protein [Myxococcales bacterium]